MKMDSLGKMSSTASSARSSGVSVGNGPTDGSSVLAREAATARLCETAHFVNIMVEFENNDREMAVDVPDSFIAHTKTPPKYPPPYQANRTLPSSGSGRSLPDQNCLHHHRHGSLNSSASPPPTHNSRDHLRIEHDGHLQNTKEGLSLPNRGTYGHNSSGFRKPTEQESLHMKKYSEEIMRKNLESERQERHEEFLRQSLRNSQKLGALKERHRASPATAGLNNSAVDNSRQRHPQQQQQQVPNLEALNKALRRLEIAGVLVGDGAEALKAVVHSNDFQSSLTFNQKLQQLSPANCAQPATTESQELTEDCLSILDGLCEDEVELETAKDLTSILCGEKLEYMLAAHDKIACRHRYSALDSVDTTTQLEDTLLERLARYSEPNIKVVRIEKTSEPLGATVKNEGDTVMVARIIRGSMAEASGLLREGDEILQVNKVSLRGKSVNEVCDVLAHMQGTLTLLVMPARQLGGIGHMNMGGNEKPQPVMHVKAHLDYDPEDDPYLPCRELGISFFKGDILHVINQRDPHWWQARREGEEDSQLPGLIPSASFQQQREAIKQTINQEMEEGGGGVHGGSNSGRMEGGRSKLTRFLCAKRSGRKKKRKGALYSADDCDGPREEAEVIAYEEVALYYPRSDRKRPVVLIGPPNIGRHELRQQLMQDGDRFAAAIPHTSRTKRPDEIDGQDYHFISRLQFEQDILARRFVEHGEYKKSYYGTSLEAIRSVVMAERICVLNHHPQSLCILKHSDIMPFVVFVAPPSLEKLKRRKLERSEPVDDEGLKEIIEHAREMEEAYGHYFDMVIVYSDLERAYQELIREINLLETEPQWVPASWMARNSFKKISYESLQKSTEL